MSLKTKQKLYAGLGDFARQQRVAGLKKKYNTGMPEMDADMEKQDRAIDDAEMPMMGKSKMSMMDTSDVAADADRQNKEYEQELDDMAEDEKWMRKQQG